MLICVLALWSHEVMVRLACSGQDLLLEPQLRVSITQRHIRCHGGNAGNECAGLGTL